MDDPHYAHPYLGGQLTDDFATYALPESPSSLHSSFSQDSTVFMSAPLPPKPSPRHRNLSLGKTGFPAAPQKQWPPQGFKAPTLQTADPMDELSDSMSPETDWLSPASRSSNMDEYTSPTGRWGGRSAEGGARQWQGSPKTSPRGEKMSPRGEKMSPRTYKLQMQAAEQERFEDEARGNPLARVNEGYVLDSDQEVHAKWQRYQQEEQRKKLQAAEAGRQRREEGTDGQVSRAEFRRYARPAERTWYNQGMETEEQRQAEEDRQERWQQLKENEANRQRQLVAPRTAMASPPPEVAVETRMVKRECWARTDGDMLVKKQCWVEEAAPTVCVQVPEHHNLPSPNPPTPPPPLRQPPAHRRVDSWHNEDDRNPPGPSGSAQQYGSESFARSRVSRQDWVEGWEQRSERRPERRRGPDRPYDSDRPHSSLSAQYEMTERGHHHSSSESSAVATFPRSEQERVEWETRSRGGTGPRLSGRRSGEFQRGVQAGGQDTRVGDWAHAAELPETNARLPHRQEMQDGDSAQERGLTVAARWSEQTSRELQFGERPASPGADASQGNDSRAVASVEERVSEVGLVAGDEKIWVEERTVTRTETVADVSAEVSGDGADVTSPTLVAEAVSRLALTSVGWDEAMHNFHDLRGVRAVVKKPEELLSPAPVSGAVTLSGLARKRAISLPTTEGGAARVLGTSGLIASHHSRGHSADEGSRGGAKDSGPFLSADHAHRILLDAATGGTTDLDVQEGVRSESSFEERPASRQNEKVTAAVGRPSSAQAREPPAALRSGADVSKDGDASRADDVSRNGRDDRGWARGFPHPPLPLSVAAIISPPGVLRGGNQVPLSRSDSYPPSERPPGKSSPVWSTTISSVPIVSAPPAVQAANTLPPRLAPLPLRTETGPPTSELVPHPPSNPSPRPPLRRASRSGASSVEERRGPPTAGSTFAQYDSEPEPKRSWRGADTPESSFERSGNQSENHESWGAAKKGDPTPWREDGNPGHLSRFAPPSRGVPPAHPAPPGRVEDAAGGEGGSPIVVEVDCPICCEPLQVGRAMFAPECGHFVHFDCCRSNLLKGSLDCPRCHQRMQQKPYLKTPYARSESDRRRVTVA